jgi:hypothetical protein
MYKQKKQSDYLVISYSITELSAPEGNHHHILAVTGKRAKKKWTSLSTSSHHTRLSTHQSTNDELTITCQSGDMFSDLTQSVLIIQIVKLLFSLSAILIVSQDPKRAAARIPATNMAAIPSDMRRPVVVIPTHLLYVLLN